MGLLQLLCATRQLVFFFPFSHASCYGAPEAKALLLQCNFFSCKEALIRSRSKLQKSAACDSQCASNRNWSSGAHETKEGYRIDECAGRCITKCDAANILRAARLCGFAARRANRFVHELRGYQRTSLSIYLFIDLFILPFPLPSHLFPQQQLMKQCAPLLENKKKFKQRWHRNLSSSARNRWSTTTPCKLATK